MEKALKNRTRKQQQQKRKLFQSLFTKNSWYYRQQNCEQFLKLKLIIVADFLSVSCKAQFEMQ